MVLSFWKTSTVIGTTDTKIAIIMMLRIKIN